MAPALLSAAWRLTSCRFKAIPIPLLLSTLSLCRWEEEKKEDGVKWKFLEHKGPLFAPAYEPLPDNVKFYYDGNYRSTCCDCVAFATEPTSFNRHDILLQGRKSNFQSLQRKLQHSMPKCWSMITLPRLYSTIISLKIGGR